MAYENALAASEKALSEVVQISRAMNHNLAVNFTATNRLLEGATKEVEISSQGNKALQAEIVQLRHDLNLQQKSVRKAKRKSWGIGVLVGIAATSLVYNFAK